MATQADYPLTLAEVLFEELERAHDVVPPTLSKEWHQIQTGIEEIRAVTVAAPVESDIDFAEGALGTIGGAAIGVSIGAAMQSPQAIAMGLVDGILMAMPPPDDRIRFTTVLTHALHLW